MKMAMPKRTNESIDRVVAEIRRIELGNHRSHLRERQIRSVVLDVQRATADAGRATTTTPDHND